MRPMTVTMSFLVIQQACKCSLLLAIFSLSTPTIAQATPNSSDVVQPCANYAFPEVVCIPNYGSVLPGSFQRTIIPTVGNTDTYASTSVPADQSFTTLKNASFILWDESRGSSILGAAPSVEVVSKFDEFAGREAPVYIPTLNQILFSELASNVTSQYVIDMNNDPPTRGSQTTSPPLKVPCGATYHAGSIYWCGSATEDGIYRPGVYVQNVTTGEVTPLVNNYYGYWFNTCDDLAVAENGDVWFTDNCESLHTWPVQQVRVFYFPLSLIQVTGYSHTIKGLTTLPKPQLEPAVYRFSPSTGLTQILDDSFAQPNGLAFAPDGKTAYITDTSSDFVDVNLPETEYQSYQKRTVYAVDVLNGGTGLANKRPIFLAQDRVPDGIKVASNGYIATATGHGVDVLDETGVPIIRVQTPFTVFNLVFAGKDLDELWCSGVAGVVRVKWNLQGHELS